MTKSTPRWRSILASVFIIIGLVLAPLSIAGLWANKYVTNTEGFTQTLAPLANNTLLQEDVASNVTATISDKLQIEQRIDDLTGESWLSNLIPANQLAARADEAVNNGVLKVVQSDRFSRLWENSLRTSHTKAAAVLSGQSNAVSLDDAGTLTFQLSDVLGDVVSSLTDLGIPGLSTITDAEWDIQVFQSEALPTVQKVYQLIVTYGPWLVYVAAAFPLAGILLKPRSITTALVSLGIILGLCALALKTLIADYAGEKLFTNLDPPVADAIYQQITAALTGAMLTTAVVALVLGVASWPIANVLRRRLA